MKTRFVDANLFIRYLTDDDPERADRVEALLTEASEGGVRLVTTEMVLAEVVWVLESVYNLKSMEVAPMIRAILATPGLEVVNGTLVDRALDHYEGRSVDFIDGYIAALMQKLGISEIYSFDRKHLSRIDGLNRIEP